MRREANIHREENRVMDERLSLESLQRYRDKRMKMNPTVKTYIDMELVPHGYVYCWVRDSFFGEKDIRRIAEAHNAQWTNVPPSRHPEVKSEQEDHIYVQGSILMERPKEYDEIDEQVRYRQACKVANYLAYMQAPVNKKELAFNIYNPHQIHSVYGRDVLNKTSFAQAEDLNHLHSMNNISPVHNHFMSFQQ
ncbi:MAG TPA: hypothetical protein VHA52_10005 [Candidatus Babeliaceae bacterium]|nr:hypothetical protein [Candidatus Babeliaceae bacterium]